MFLVLKVYYFPNQSIKVYILCDCNKKCREANIKQKLGLIGLLNIIYFVKQKSFKRTFKTGVGIQNHLFEIVFLCCELTIFFIVKKLV